MIIFQKSNHAIVVAKMTIFGFIFTFISQGPFKFRSNTDHIQTTIANAKTTVATPAAAGLETQHVSGRYFFFCLVYSTNHYSPRQHQGLAGVTHGYLRRYPYPYPRKPLPTKKGKVIIFFIYFSTSYRFHKWTDHTFLFYYTYIFYFIIRTFLI